MTTAVSLEMENKGVSKVRWLYGHLWFSWESHSQGSHRGLLPIPGRANGSIIASIIGIPSLCLRLQESWWPGWFGLEHGQKPCPSPTSNHSSFWSLMEGDCCKYKTKPRLRFEGIWLVWILWCGLLLWDKLHNPANWNETQQRFSLLVLVFSRHYLVVRFMNVKG